MKWTSFIAFAFGLALPLAGYGSATAEPGAAPPCYETTTPTHDMAGICLAPELLARIEVNACGGVEVMWDNEVGRHLAYYMATERLPGGGFIAAADVAVDGIFPDDADVVGIKPAERGAIELITADPYGNITGAYRLQKTR